MSNSKKNVRLTKGKKYTQPVLLTFGAVSQLTTGGTGNVFESGGPQGEGQADKHP